MPSSTRRAYLAALGGTALAATAGCLARNPAEGGTTDVVADVAVTQNVQYLLAGVHPTAVTLTDRQVVFVTVADRAGPVAPSDVGLRVGDRVFRNRSAVAGVERTASKRVRDADATVPMFVLPLSLAADAGAVTVPDGTESLPAPVVDQLADPPRLSVRGVSVPESATPADAVRVTVHLRNDGGHPGEFAATIGDASLSGRPIYRTTVPAGATVAWDHVVSTYPNDDGSARILVDWTTGSRSVTVTA
ncbi:MAG: hypothetical protein ABEJ67_03645 [Halanaeroarchaeum sp.]